MDRGKRQFRWQIPFFAMWGGQLVSLVGSKVAQFALVWWLTELTGAREPLPTAALIVGTRAAFFLVHSPGMSQNVNKCSCSVLKCSGKA